MWNSKWIILVIVIAMDFQLVYMEVEKSKLRLQMYFNADDSKFGDWLRAVVENDLNYFLPYLDFTADVCVSVEVDEKKKTLKCGAPDESCFLNRLHACATSLDSEPMVRFMACSAMTKNGIPRYENCRFNGVDTQDLIECAKNNTGYNECVEMFKGVQGELGPPIPFFLTNDVSSVYIHELFNFKEKMCGYMKAFHVPFPTYCQP